MIHVTRKDGLKLKNHNLKIEKEEKNCTIKKDFFKESSKLERLIHLDFLFAQEGQCHNF